MPGTAFYEKMLAQRRIEEFDWACYDMAHPVLRSEHFTRQQLLDQLDNCYTAYYKRAGKIIRHGIFGDEFARYTYRFLRFVNAVRQIKEGKL
jgi:hypothetical protein